MNKSSKKLPGSSKKAIILALVCLALLCGSQQRKKDIYKVPLSAHVAELEQQERAYRDSLEKYCALLDTAQIQHYLDLHQSASAAYSAALRQEVDAFMAERDKEVENAANDIISPQMTILCILAVVILALLIYISIVTMFWTRLGWFFEDTWHWLKRRPLLRRLFRFFRRLSHRLRRLFHRLFDPSHSPLVNGSFAEDETLTDDDIHEIMHLIHHGNPPKYEIRKKE